MTGYWSPGVPRPLDELGAPAARGSGDPEAGRCRTATTYARPPRRTTRACWNVLEDAFLEWSVRDREPSRGLLAEVPKRPGFEPWNLRIVTDAEQADRGCCGQRDQRR